ncbi:MAG: PTS sugar transporter subunit IIA [Phycisphaerales bacterium]|nr:PTS sugar transporter subunit IIA [Phycisphaerales bacterium]
MNLIDILNPKCICSPLQSVDKQDVINELVDALAASGQVSDSDSLKSAVWTREQTRTTGIGHGLAIPHGKCSTMKGLAIAIGKPAQPIDFEAIDSQPVQLIVLLASPPDKTSDHIQALAHISRMMNDASFREEIYNTSSPETIYEIIKEQST